MYSGDECFIQCYFVKFRRAVVVIVELSKYEKVCQFEI